MDDKTDLKPYLLAIGRNWRIIVATGLLLGVIFGIGGVLSDPYWAQLRLILPLDLPREQRKILLDLVRDINVESRVAESLRSLGRLPSEYQPGTLIGRIRVKDRGGFILEASAKTPEDAQLLVRLWAREFIRVTIEILSENPALIEVTERQLAEAQQRYRQAQTELEEFIASGELAVANLEVRRRNDLLESNRAVIFIRLDEHLRRRNEIELVLRDARLLRQRLLAEDDGSVADGVAALLLRMRNLSARNNNQPILQLDSSLLTTTDVSVGDIDQLIDSLEKEYQAIQIEIERITKETEVSQLQGLIRDLVPAQVRVEQLTARQRDIVTERDLAFERVKALQQRLDGLLTKEPVIAVREAGPKEFVFRDRLSILVRAAMAALAGIALVTATVLTREAIKLSRTEARSQPT